MQGTEYKEYVGTGQPKVRYMVNGAVGIVEEVIQLRYKFDAVGRAIHLLVVTDSMERFDLVSHVPNSLYFQKDGAELHFDRPTGITGDFAQLILRFK